MRERKQKTSSDILGLDYVLDVPELGVVKVDQDIELMAAQKIQAISDALGVSGALVLRAAVRHYLEKLEMQEKIVPF